MKSALLVTALFLLLSLSLASKEESNYGLNDEHHGKVQDAPIFKEAREALAESKEKVEDAVKETVEKVKETVDKIKQKIEVHKEVDGAGNDSEKETVPKEEAVEGKKEEAKATKKDRLYVYGFDTCPHFRRAVEMATNAHKEFPDSFKKPTTKGFPNRDEYQKWLKNHNKVKAGKNHRTSPFVWRNKEDFIGGGDNLYGFLADKFPKSKLVESFGKFYPPRP
eukprot:TRINITY_DN6581_c0_g1_i1.p1 TRINITY_DN6581_c0_g1~~TRINITY_DN6581_c0_g1_i1.p1  ORF type:complete len:222 (+),score=90.30 TRINITY_DN6581_c0_g1_i1:29-694(+)